METEVYYSVDPAPTEKCKPIERFRKDYGRVCPNLRERSLIEPHPSVDHAWIAARAANTFGYYRPCESYEADFRNAVAEWEKRKRGTTGGSSSLIGLMPERSALFKFARNSIAFVHGMSSAKVFVLSAIGHRLQVRQVITRGRARAAKLEEYWKRQEEEQMLEDYFEPVDEGQDSETEWEGGFEAGNGAPLIDSAVKRPKWKRWLGKA